MRKLLVLLTGTVARVVLALGVVLALLLTVVDAHAASRGISVELKKSEVPGASQSKSDDPLNRWCHDG